MLQFDVTNRSRQGHHSGLNRVSTRLEQALGLQARPFRWGEAGGPASGAEDWFFTPELFSEEERPGFARFLAEAPCRKAALFHDAIPLKFPSTTWPKSVARHPGYMKRLASFDRVFAVSKASREELLGFWTWQGLEKVPEVSVLPLGADFDGSPRRVGAARLGEPPVFLCLGILEPRKNQSLLLEACQGLWDEGLVFELHLAGRVNPHFGKALERRVLSLKRRYKGLCYHRAPDDRTLAELLSRTRALLFPTLAEGCGLPLLEALWRGIPCVCSDLPVLLENAEGGGCLPVRTGEVAAWREALRRLLREPSLHALLAAEARSRALPTWSECARQLLEGLR